MKNQITLILCCSFIILSGCVSTSERALEIGSESRPEQAVEQKNDINNYAYLESSTGVYNGKRAEEEKLLQLQKEAAAARLTATQAINYSKSEEEKIENLAMQYIVSQQWKMALNTLIKYEPVLTHNKNLTHQLIFVSLKLEYYDFAIDQLRLALQQKFDPKIDGSDYFDKQVILAHAYYLSDKYKQAEGLYKELYKTENYPEAAEHLFMLGYKQKDLDMMNTYLEILGKNHPEYIHFNILTAQLEQQKGLTQVATERMEQLFIDRGDYADQADLTLQYAHMMIQNNQLEEALKVLEAPAYRTSDSKPYHFVMAYVQFLQGNKEKFQKHLSLAGLDDKHRKDLAMLFLNKANYTEVYNKIFQQDIVEDHRLSQVVKKSAEKYTYKYINKPQFKDAVLVREEFRPVTEPIRLPASLEFDQSK